MPNTKPPVPSKTSDREGQSQDPTTIPTISELLGSVPTLPGESAERYRASLNALITELEARTVMQVYLAEKIHECLWWIRRYEEQKRATIITEIASLTSASSVSVAGPLGVAHVRDVLLNNQVDKKTAEIFKSIGHTTESLRQMALLRKREVILQLDQQIALQAKILAGFQASYEVTSNRKLNIERLHLQNEMIRRDLQAIEGVKDDKPKAAARKSP